MNLHHYLTSVLIREASHLQNIHNKSIANHVVDSNENTEEIKVALKRVDGALLTFQVRALTIHNAV
jgi:hypothetical protein